MNKVISLLGAVAALGLMFYGRQHTPKILLAIFAVWVLAPFVALLRVPKIWAAVITAGTLAIYGYAAFGPPMAKPASVFLAVPLISWVLIYFSSPRRPIM
jgi:hypothetical protein